MRNYIYSCKLFVKLNTIIVNIACELVAQFELINTLVHYNMSMSLPSSEFPDDEENILLCFKFNSLL